MVPEKPLAWGKRGIDLLKTENKGDDNSASFHDGQIRFAVSAPTRISGVLVQSSSKKRPLKEKDGFAAA